MAKSTFLTIDLTLLFLLSDLCPFFKLFIVFYLSLGVFYSVNDVIKTGFETIYLPITMAILNSLRYRILVEFAFVYRMTDIIVIVFFDINHS